MANGARFHQLQIAVNLCEQAVANGARFHQLQIAVNLCEPCAVPALI